MHRGREKTRRGIFVFERRVFDHQQADALQRGMQVAQCQHDGRARALAAQEARLARRAEHEGVQRIVQRLAELDAEIGGGAMQDFAARVVQRDRAITRVRQRLLQAGHPARRNFNDLLVEHRRTDGRLARIRRSRGQCGLTWVHSLNFSKCLPKRGLQNPARTERDAARGPVASVKTAPLI